MMQNNKEVQVFFDHEILFWTYEKLIKAKNMNLNPIVGSTNNLVRHFKKMGALVWGKKLVHEAGHLNWMKNSAC